MVCKALASLDYMMLIQATSFHYFNPQGSREPRRRSTTICDISDDELSQMRRRARDPISGKQLDIPASMTYEQWYAKYVKGRKEAEEKEKQMKRRKKKG